MVLVSVLLPPLEDVYCHRDQTQGAKDQQKSNLRETMGDQKQLLMDAHINKLAVAGPVRLLTLMALLFVLLWLRLACLLNRLAFSRELNVANPASKETIIRTQQTPVCINTAVAIVHVNSSRAGRRPHVHSPPPVTSGYGVGGLLQAHGVQRLVQQLHALHTSAPRADRPAARPPSPSP